MDVKSGTRVAEALTGQGVRARAVIIPDAGHQVLIGLVWFGLVWFGLVWFGLVWFGLVWFDRSILTISIFSAQLFLENPQAFDQAVLEFALDVK